MSSDASSYGRGGVLHKQLGRIYTFLLPVHNFFVVTSIQIILESKCSSLCVLSVDMLSYITTV